MRNSVNYFSIVLLFVFLVMTGCGGGGTKADNNNDAITKPSAPIIGVATAGNGQVTVTFNPPLSDGGSAVIDYTATSSPGNFTANGITSPLTVTGLDKDTLYTFTVTAINSAGVSAASEASNSVAPLAPAKLSVNGTAGKAVSLNGKYFVPTTRNNDLFMTIFTDDGDSQEITILATADYDVILGIVAVEGYGVYALCAQDTTGISNSGKIWLIRIDPTTTHVVASWKLSDEAAANALTANNETGTLFFEICTGATQSMIRVNGITGEVLGGTTDSPGTWGQFTGPILLNSNNDVYIIGEQMLSAAQNRISAWKYSGDLLNKKASVDITQYRPFEISQELDGATGAILSADGTKLYISGAIDTWSANPRAVWLTYDATSLAFISAQDIGPALTQNSGYSSLVSDSAGNIFGIYRGANMVKINPLTGMPTWTVNADASHLAISGNTLLLSVESEVLLYNTDGAQVLK